MTKMSTEQLLSKVFSKLVVELQAQDASVDEAVNVICKALQEINPQKMPNPKGVLNTLCDYKEFNIKRENKIITFPFDDEPKTKEKGGDNIIKTRKITPELRKQGRDFVRRKKAFVNKEIRGQIIWGIGPKAIVLVPKDKIVFEKNHIGGVRKALIRDYYGEEIKDYHDFFKGGDGFDLMKEILDKYDRD